MDSPENGVESLDVAGKSGERPETFLKVGQEFRAFLEECPAELGEFVGAEAWS
jgi:hypothetical protein